MGIHHRIHNKQNDNTHATMHVQLPSVNKLHGEQSFRLLFFFFFDSSLPRAARARFSQKAVQWTTQRPFKVKHSQSKMQFFNKQTHTYTRNPFSALSPGTTQSCDKTTYLTATSKSLHESLSHGEPLSDCSRAARPPRSPLLRC